MAASGPLDSFGTILSGLAKRLGLESRLLELRIQHHWRDLVGEPIASHTWPDQIRFKKLYLVVQNSVWLQQLTFLKPTLLAKLNAEAGTNFITEIVLRVGEIPSFDQPSASVAAAASQPSVSEAALTEASAHAASVKDPDLRTRLTQVMAEALSRPDRS
jgi:predicted nucleic acid-binding Zn ribbon protein